MCDIILAPPSATATGHMLFGKNSDRQRNEAQFVERSDGADHGADAWLACTYIRIPQVPRTARVLLCRPFWMWGAEMGANEHGVVIGNEGLLARGPQPETEALTGMDLVRLGLERASTASEAVEVITQLLGQYGQGGNCGHLTPAYYNNSFMIADAGEAFVVETIGKDWLVERVCGVRALSNAYSIAGAVHAKSDGLNTRICEAGWGDPLAGDYPTLLADPARQHIGQPVERFRQARALLDQRTGALDAADMMRVLRAHGAPDASGRWAPGSATSLGLCIHAKGSMPSGQTTGAMVSALSADHSVHWVTATAAPCTSIFKPVLLDAPLPAFGPEPTDRFDAESGWWKHELLHRGALAGDFPAHVETIARERDAIEAEFAARIRGALASGDPDARAAAVERCWCDAAALEDAWRARLEAPSFEDSAYATGWRAMNRLAEMPLADESGHAS